MVRSKGMTVYTNKPRWVWKAVFHSLPSLIWTKLKLFLRSMTVKEEQPVMRLIRSWSKWERITILLGDGIKALIIDTKTKVASFSFDKEDGR